MKSFLLCVLVCHVAAAQVVYKVQIVRDGHVEIAAIKSEEYVAAVLAGESSTFRSDEALQAMAVAARTYAAKMRGRHSAEGFDFCSTTHCQRLELGEGKERLRAAARATAGQILWYEGTPAFTVYSRDCGGRSEDARAVWPDVQAPYLRVREDQYCTRHGASRWEWTASLEDIGGALQRSGLQCPQPLSRVTIARTTTSGRVKVLTLENGASHIQISASSFRFALGRTLGWNGLRSERYEIFGGDGKLRFQGLGQGHGVGLCQNGADAMGIEGKTFREILAYYYPGTEIGTTARGLRWKTLGGNGVTILTTTPDVDHSLVTVAESVRESLANKVPLPQPGSITVRVYPTVEVFRNATGEPGWVAARTSGTIVEIQPQETLRARGVLRSTLRHEFLHVAVETTARPDLPLWFREGLVDCLSSKQDAQSSPKTPILPSDDTLRQRTNEQFARKNYHAAKWRVDNLLSRYGEETVLGWLRTGLPAEVRNSIESKAKTNSR